MASRAEVIVAFKRKEMAYLRLAAQFFVSSDGTCRPKDLPATPKQKEAVWKRDDGRCVVCGRELNPILVKPYSWGWGDDKRPTGNVDHIVPRARGGSRELSNLRLVCELFNLRRKAAVPGNVEGSCVW